ncbi:MAG: hypothetical protein ACXVBE_06630 [Bdellovibrionota bacterium]
MSIFLALAMWLATLPAMAAHFNSPTWNGYALDWCKNFESGCGKPAADMFCQKKGYPGAGSFVQLPHVNFQTMTIGQNAVCDPRSHTCDSFASIDCQEVAIRTFAAPMYNGYRVDWCRNFETACGAPAALLYCQKSGYNQLVNFSIQAHVSFPTMTVGSNAICNPSFHGCDSFSFIQCKH